jgi:rubrerythrin
MSMHDLDTDTGDLDDMDAGHWLTCRVCGHELTNESEINDETCTICFRKDRGIA